MEWYAKNVLATKSFLKKKNNYLRRPRRKINARNALKERECAKSAHSTKGFRKKLLCNIVVLNKAAYVRFISKGFVSCIKGFFYEAFV